jgi:hypothetical protein
MDPFDYAPAGTTQWTLRNLTPLGIYYLAVVAEDALEQWNPVVRSVSAQSSIGMLGEVRQLAVDCGLDALHFTWLPPAGAEPTVNDFLGGYRVYFGEATTPVALDRFATQFEATGLLPAHAYPFRITTLDKFGVESAGSLIPAGTLMPNPAGLVASPLHGKVRLAWTPEEPAGLVLLYAVYVSEADFTTVEGKTPVLETAAAEAEVTGLENGRAYYFAVTTVNTGGCSDPAVETVRAVPAVPVHPPVAGDDVAGTVKDQPVLLPIVRLLANDTDPDDDPLTLSLPSAATSEGGVVARNGSHVQYTPPAGFTGPDTFTYQVADGWGGTDTATVTVTVRKPEGVGFNTISAVRDADGSVHLRMAGIPGRSYQVWFAPDVVAGPWTLLDTVVADLLGVVSYTDTSAVGVPVRFYRLGATP